MVAPFTAHRTLLQPTPAAPGTQSREIAHRLAGVFAFETTKVVITSKMGMAVLPVGRPDHHVQMRSTVKSQ